MFGGKLRSWLTPARAIALGIAVLGGGLLVGGTVGSVASRDSSGAAADTTPLQATQDAVRTKDGAGANQHAAAGPVPETLAPAAAPPEPLRIPEQLTTSEPEPAPRLRLAPQPDIERRARRMAALKPAPNAAKSVAPPPLDPDAAWQRFAAASVPADGPIIAIVIDDSGHHRAKTARLAAFDQGVLTFAFLPYVEHLAEQTETVRRAGHEVLLHMPMEPLNPELDTGPNALRLDLSESEFTERLTWNLGRFEGYVGINNHMGSRFTADEPSMRRLMATLAARGLLFLDSRTTTLTQGAETAAAAGVPYLRRDVFLDNKPETAHVAAQLRATEAAATRQGFAIAIGHAHDWTAEALEAWAPQARERGFTLVPLTAILKRHMADAEQHAASN